jgi:N-acetylneuraminic acid mutarotase
MLLRTLALLALVPPGARAADWEKLAPIPNKDGVAGPFAGVSGGALLVAGGANFPDKKPWEGGAKVWHDAAFVLEKPGGEWKHAGKLPRALGYGVSVSHRGAVVCAGGSDSRRHYAECFRLEWRDGKLHTSELPKLPRPVANGCGALVGDVLFVFGGQEEPDSAEASAAAYRIDLSAKEPKWDAVPAFPGRGRVLAVAAAFDGKFYVIGGAALAKGKREYLRDAYSYSPKDGWKRIADLPHALAAAPSPAPAHDAGFDVLGGDDGSQVGVAPEKHTGFRKEVLRYDAKANKWIAHGELSASRVTVPCAEWNGAVVIPSGEVRPGVRSPDVWRAKR